MEQSEFTLINDRIVKYNEKKEMVAFVTFSFPADQIIDVEHTFVDDSLRGQGIAGKLMLSLVDYLRSTGKKAKLSCSYAVSWFEKHPEYKDFVWEAEEERIRKLLKLHYPFDFLEVKLLRKGGNHTYSAQTASQTFFLKVVGTAFADTFLQSLSIQRYLLEKKFPTPKLVETSAHEVFFMDGVSFYALYEFLETTEIEMEEDAKEVGDLTGRLHFLMKTYSDPLVEHDKKFFLERYLRILKQKNYPKWESFQAYGERMWNRVKDLPRGYSHGDLYCGNIGKTSDGKLVVFDFDTSCYGFPTYDIALICNKTDYFQYRKDGFLKTKETLERFLPEYQKYVPLSEQEKASVFPMLALYHFALQATMIEIHGIHCVDDAFFDEQLSWLLLWEEEIARA